MAGTDKSKVSRGRGLSIALTAERAGFPTHKGKRALLDPVNSPQRLFLFFLVCLVDRPVRETLETELCLSTTSGVRT